MSSLGGPGRGITLPQMVAGWLDDADAVLPQEQVYPKDVTEKQTEQIYREQMVGSQQDATVAALTELGIQVPATLRIAGVSAEVPAATVLRKGDVIVAVAGQGISTYGQLRTALRALPAGGATTITVRRGGERRRLATRTATAPDGRTVLGVVLDPTFTFPFTVRIQIDDIGGPSAGMMFALGIIDNLTPGELTGGRRIAGTGTIDPDGSVGPIDGIRQKMVGARRAGAGWFLAPADNCPEVLGRVPAGLRVVKVATLHQAHAAVQGIASGGAGLAGC